MGHIRGTSRCARRGSASLTPLAKALAKFGFFAPLTEDVFLDKGYGAASFTRATTATVVDHEGCIRNCLSGEVRFHGQRRVRNWLAVPEDFSSATWTTIAGGTGTVPTKTANYASAPDGTTTACRVQATVSAGTASGDYSLMRQAATYAGTGAVGSVWMKSNTGASQVVIVSYDEVVAVTVTTSWQRFSWPRTVGSNHFDIGCRGDSAANKTVDVLVWHPQMEALVGASNQNPSEYVSVGANKLNELTYTEEFDNAAWTKVRSSITANTVANPLNGAVNAEKLVEDGTAANTHFAQQSFTVVSGMTYTISVYVKAAGRNYFGIQGGGNLNSATSYFDLALGEVNSNFNGATNAITSLGDGWYRCSMTRAATGSGSVTVSFLLCNSADNASYNGDSTSGAYIYGAQSERASSPSTYFPVGSVYPYHGACVDGVKYFSTLNGNTVASNVVTEATGAAITRPENDGLTNGLVLPNVSGNSASITDAGAILGSGDVDLRGTLTPSAWNSAAQQAVAFKTNSFEFGIGGGGAFIYFWFSLDGGVSINTFKTVSGVSFSDASTGWVRVTREKATGDVKFYESADGVAWTQVGATQTSTAGVAVGGNANQLYFGIANSTRGIIGVLSRAQLRSAIGGTTVFDADFSAQALGTTTFTESSSNAATVTINRSGAVPAYIGNPLRLFNYDGYLAESARTNLVLQSSNFGTSWSFTGTPTRSAAAAYCGEIALDLIGDDDAGAQEGYRQDITFTGDATKSVSFLVKQGTSTSSIVQLLDTIAAADRLAVAVTWSGGVPVCTYATGSAERASEYMGGGVWRIFCLSTSVTAANTNSLRFYPAKTVADALTPTGDVYIGGVQAENATTASVSHIPTTTATVTRNADDLRYSAAGNILGTVGSAYAEAPSGTGPNISGRFVDSAGTGVPLMRSGGTGAVLGFNDGATTVTIGTLDGGFSTTPYKVACAWGSSLVSGAVNGTLDSANAFDGDATLTTAISPGGAASVGLEAPIRNVRVSVQKISDADLQLITQ